MAIRIPNTYNPEEIRRSIQRLKDAGSSYQPIDADLTAISILSGVGYLRRTGTNTWELADVDVDTSNLVPYTGATQDISANTHKITDVVDPENDQDAATKKYVDDSIGGIDTSNLVPYTGATHDVDLGTHTITAANLNIDNWDAAGLIEDTDLKCLVTGLISGGMESDPVFSAWQAAYDNHANWDTAYGWGNWAHTTLAGYGITDAAPLSFKTTLDALTGFIKCDGAGTYSAEATNPFMEGTVVTGTTTDGSIKAIATIEVPQGKILTAQAWVVGNNSANHSIGIGTFLMATAHNAAGTATFVGSSTNIVQNRSSSPYSASFTVSGTNLVLNVTGSAGVTMNWKAYYRSFSY